MPTPTTPLETQIDAAFEYRGDVTVTLIDGTALGGFLCNRVFANPRIAEDHFIELLEPSGQKQRIANARIARVELTGEDHAAGKSYQEWLDKKHPKKQSA
jgi:uncharacterized protein YneF (UPF0154 family)